MQISRYACLAFVLVGFLAFAPTLHRTVGSQGGDIGIERDNETAAAPETDMAVAGGTEGSVSSGTDRGGEDVLSTRRLLKTISALIVVLLLAVLLISRLAPFLKSIERRACLNLPPDRGSSQRVLRVVDRLRIDRDNQLSIIAYGDERLLMSSGPGGVVCHGRFHTGSGAFMASGASDQTCSWGDFACVEKGVGSETHAATVKRDADQK